MIDAHIPPPQYDHAYAPAIIRHLAPADMLRECSYLNAAGCQAWEGSTCIIFVRAPTPSWLNGKGDGYVVRHEMGHCNGWPENHPR